MGNGITKENLLASLGRVEASFRLRYMGIGCVWAWLYCTYATSAVFPDREGRSINADETWLLSAATVVVAFVIGGVLLSRREDRKMESWHLPVAASTLLAAGTVISFFGSAVAGFVWLGGVMTGVGYATLSLLWARALMALDIEELEVAVPLASLVTVPCVMIFPLLEGVAGVAATTLLPLFSGALLLLCMRDKANDRRGGEGAAREKDSPAAVPQICRGSGELHGTERQWSAYLTRVAIVLVAIYIAIGWQAALAEAKDGLQVLVGIDVAMLLSSLASVALGVAIVFFSKKVSFTALFRWAVPCVVAALALREIPVPWMSFVVNATGDTLDSLIQVLVYLFTITLAKRGKISVALGVGMLQGSVQLGVLVGNLAGSACAGPDAMWPLSVATPLLICLVVLVSIFAPQREPEDEQHPALVGSDAIERSLLEGCQRLQEQFGLSDRETEIALLLARGRSRPYIRETLFISKNTVATHIRHIYSKLDIHSKEELADLVAEASKR